VPSSQRRSNESDRVERICGRIRRWLLHVGQPPQALGIRRGKARPARSESSPASV
jgi:hypothetical protein